MHTQAELKWEGQPADGTQTELKKASHSQQAAWQPLAVECCSKDAQTDTTLQESKLTQTCLAAVTQQTQTVVCKRLQISQLTQTPVLLHHVASTQTEQLEACKAQQTQPAQSVLKAALTQTEYSLQEAAWTQTEQSVHEGASTQTEQSVQEAASTQTDQSVREAALTQTEQHTQQASLCTQTPAPLQQPGSTQTEHMGSQMSQHTQTPVLLQHAAAAQAVVETADAGSQSDTQAEQSSAAEQQVEALRGEVMGLQLKVQSLQGIIDIQEQQLKAAAGQSNDAADQVGLYLLYTHKHGYAVKPYQRKLCRHKVSCWGCTKCLRHVHVRTCPSKLSPQPKLQNLVCIVVLHGSSSN